MGESTTIGWCHCTFNPWRGCTKVSEGCTHCYAEKQSHRNPAVLGEWGDDGKRVVAAETYWQMPRRWDKRAGNLGQRWRVFCLSLGDIFEDRVDLVGPRRRLGALITETPNLDWLLLTKRPEHWDEACGQMWYRPVAYTPLPPNVWVGVSAEDQHWWDRRVAALMMIPARVRFVSAEPLLDAIDGADRLRGPHRPDWCIIGGESGPAARPCHLAWVRRLAHQCVGFGVPVFVKQLGAFVTDATPVPVVRDPRYAEVFRRRVKLADAKGANPEEWPPDLRIQEFPCTASASAASTGTGGASTET